MEHLRAIKNFKKDLVKSLINFDDQSKISIHFNENDHLVSRDLCFFIFKTGIDNINFRKSIETDLINLFVINKIPILNKKIPKINYIKYLSFQTVFS